MLDPLRNAVADRLHTLVGSSRGVGGGTQLRQDDGLFGPGSIA